MRELTERDIEIPLARAHALTQGPMYASTLSEMVSTRTISGQRPIPSKFGLHLRGAVGHQKLPHVYSGSSPVRLQKRTHQLCARILS